MKLADDNDDKKYPPFVEVGPGNQLGMILKYISKKVFLHYESYSI